MGDLSNSRSGSPAGPWQSFQTDGNDILAQQLRIDQVACTDIDFSGGRRTEHVTTYHMFLPTWRKLSMVHLR